MNSKNHNKNSWNNRRDTAQLCCTPAAMSLTCTWARDWIQTSCFFARLAADPFVSPKSCCFFVWNRTESNFWEKTQYEDGNFGYHDNAVRMVSWQIGIFWLEVSLEFSSAAGDAMQMKQTKTTWIGHHHYHHYHHHHQHCKSRSIRRSESNAQHYQVDALDQLEKVQKTLLSK